MSLDYVKNVKNGKYVGPLTVNGDLNLRRTGITELPSDLSVGGDLDLRYTGITELPADLKVAGKTKGTL